MTKERIQLTHEIVTNNAIKIQNEHTLFCRMERIIFPDINVLEKEVKQLRKHLKEMKVKLIKTDTLKLLKERKNEYTEAVNDYNNSFDQLVNEWRVKLENGLFCGYSDDDHLNDIIKPLTWKIERMNHRGTILSEIRDIQRKINDIKNELKYQGENTYFVQLAI